MIGLTDPAGEQRAISAGEAFEIAKRASYAEDLQIFARAEWRALLRDERREASRRAQERLLRERQ